MKTAITWIRLLEKDKVITSDSSWKERLASLIICGAIETSVTKEAVSEWIHPEINMELKTRQAYFDACWKRLEKNGVFKNGKIYADLEDEETSFIEFCLLILVAEGKIKRSLGKKK